MTHFWQIEYKGNDSRRMEDQVIKGTPPPPVSSVFLTYFLLFTFLSSFLSSFLSLFPFSLITHSGRRSMRHSRNPVETHANKELRSHMWVWKQIFPPQPSLKWLQPCEGPWARIIQAAYKFLMTETEKLKMLLLLYPIYIFSNWCDLVWLFTLGLLWEVIFQNSPV